MYNIKAIETRYKGRIYRSRLEAKYAALFDLLKWRFEYEPHDMSGWMPDFKIYGDNEVFVEIKPQALVDGNVIRKLLGAGKINAVILTDTININGSIGSIVNYENDHLASVYCGSNYPCDVKDYPDGRYDMGSHVGNFEGLIYNEPKYRKYFMDTDGFLPIWNESSNIVMKKF